MEKNLSHLRRLRRTEERRLKAEQRKQEKQEDRKNTEEQRRKRAELNERKKRGCEALLIVIRARLVPSRLL